MSEHDLENLIRESEERAAKRGHTATQDLAQRSWRTVETAGRYAKCLIVRAGNKRLADDAPGLDRHYCREDAGKVCVQCAASVSEVSALIAVMMGLSFIPVNMRMLVMGVRSKRIRNRLRAGAR